MDSSGAVTELFDRLIAADTLTERYRVTTEVGRGALDADECLITVIEDDELVVRARAGADTDGVGGTVPLSHPIVGQMVMSDDPVVIDDFGDVRSAAAGSSSVPEGERYRSLLSVPIHDTGVFWAASADPGAFAPTDRQRAEHLVSCLRAALDHLPTVLLRGDGHGNARLDEIASILSHDFATPISVVRGSIELAERTGDLDHLDRARTALDRIENLTESVVMLARTGDRIGETEMVAFDEVVENAWTIAGVDDATLSREADGTLVANESALCQLLVNLFENAITHAEGPVAVRVGFLDSGTGFYVEDDGPGIPPDDRDRAFEWGYSSSDGHTGIGLAIVDRIADAHGWTVAATESDDGGARFEFEGVTVGAGNGD